MHHDASMHQHLAGFNEFGGDSWILTLHAVKKNKKGPFICHTSRDDDPQKHLQKYVLKSDKRGLFVALTESNETPQDGPSHSCCYPLK